MMDWSISESFLPASAAEAPACASMASVLKATCASADMWLTETVSKGLSDAPDVTAKSNTEPP